MKSSLEKNYSCVMAIIYSLSLPFPIVISLFCLFPPLDIYVVIILIWTLIYISTAFYLYDKIKILYFIHSEYKIVSKYPDQWQKSNSLSDITFKQIMGIEKLKKEQKRNIKEGNAIDGFELINNGKIALVFYHHKNVNTYAIVIYINPKRLILINDTFKKTIYPKFGSIKNKSPNIYGLFEQWAEKNNIEYSQLFLSKL